MYAAAQSANSRRKENRRRRQLQTVFRVSLILWGVVLIVGLIGPVMQIIYTDKALPGATLGGVPVYGWSKEELLAFIEEAMNTNVINVIIDDTAASATPSELGISVNAEKSIAPLMDHAPWWPLALSHRNAELQGQLDRSVLDSWLAKKFPRQMTTPVNAWVVFDPESENFVIRESVPGLGVSPQDKQQLFHTILANPTIATVTMTSGPVDAEITDDEAGATRDYLNDRIALDISLHGNGLTYTLTHADIASLATVSTTPAGTLAASFQTATVVAFLQRSVAPALNADAIPRLVFEAPDGTVLYVEQEGHGGTSLADPESAAIPIVASLVDGTDVSLDLTFTQGLMETISTTYVLPEAVSNAVPDGHWADVDLARQTVTLMDGGTPTRTFTMSSGSPDHPTPTGIYPVYQKVPSQTVAGCVGYDCYSFPDVRWCTWFNGNYGFHTAYWHEDFGKPVSHGCLNLREADARKVYDWLEKGDEVVVH
jgi:lipoprotein-anchoring transpeptidase ErfK/SrfK